jgi:hypothetical protein
MLIAGASSRLLPASIPFRYFGAAAVAQLLAWAMLYAGADAATVFAGGLGPALAALHLVTLGVLAMTAMGASLQLLPVATRQPIASVRLAALAWWLFAPGVLALAWGMARIEPVALALGGLATGAGLAVYAWLLGRNLWRARGMREVVLHGWVALAALVGTIGSGIAMVAALAHGVPIDYRAMAGSHVVLASFGFMGMLSLGLSYVLVPLFVLSPTPDPRRVRRSWQLAVAALALGTAAPWTGWHVLPTAAALALALAAVLTHLALMRATIARGMRRADGSSFALVYVAWTMWIAALVAGGALALLPAPPAPLFPLFGVLLVAGWLLSFALGILQRIAPFLASMHAPRVRGMAPTVSSLTPRLPLRVHLGCHGAALALLLTAVVTVQPSLTRVAALFGMVGATALLTFLAGIRRRLLLRGLLAPAAKAEATR